MGMGSLESFSLLKPQICYLFLNELCHESSSDCSDVEKWS